MFHLQPFYQKNPLPLLVINQCDMQIISVNNTATETYGYTQKEFLSITFLDLFPEEDRKMFEAVYKESKNEKTDYGIWRHQKSNNIILNVTIHCFDKFPEKNSGSKLISILPHEPEFIIPSENGQSKIGIFNFLKKENVTTEDFQWLETFYNYVLDHIDEHIKVEDLCYHLAQSTRTINRYSKEITGFAPSQLIQNIKLRRAELLWKHNIVRNKEKLAQKIGYSDSYYIIQKIDDMN